MAKFTIAKSDGLGALPGRGVVLSRAGALAGLGTDDRFGDPPQTERHQADGDDPQHQRAAGLAGSVARAPDWSALPPAPNAICTMM